MRTTGTPLALTGPVNFRDIGGYETEDGSVVRRGRMFRSDGLWALSETDSSHLVDDLGLRTVVDLRSPMEVDGYGPSLLERSGLEVHRIAFLDENLRPDLPADGEWTLEDVYLFLLRHAGDRSIMLSVLDALRSEFGSVEGWARFHGLEQDAIDGLRAMLLERP